MDYRLGFGLILGCLAFAGCGGHGSAESYSDTNDSYDTYDTCNAPYGAGEDGPGVACCGAGDCCGGAECCGAPGGCNDTGYWCTTDEECGPGSTCDEGVCVGVPVDGIVECETSPALADATFGAGTNDRPGALAVTDFTGDGIDDLLIGRSSGVAIWESRGDATFQEVGLFDPLVGAPRDMAVVDLDADMTKEIVVLGDGQPGRLGTLRVDELDPEMDGGYIPDPVITAGAAPVRLGTGDVNGDGFLDIVLMSKDLPDLNVVHVMLADGVGGFLVPLDVTLSQPPLDMVLTEVTGDATLDLVVANPNGVTVLQGRGTGGFDVLAELTTPLAATSAGVAVADLDGNGSMEIVEAGEVGGAGQLSIWTWVGETTEPVPTKNYSLGPGLTRVIVDDIDADGAPDLIAATGFPTGGQVVAGEILVMPVNPDGTVRCQSVFGLAKPAVALVTADFDGDGARDIATASGEDTITLLLSSG